MCRPREDHRPPPSRSTPAGAGWEEDGLHLLARDRGSDADALISSVHSQLATSLDITDILVVAERECRTCPPSTLRGDTGTGPMSSVEERMRRDRMTSSECPALVLASLYNGMLDIVGDCRNDVQEGHGSAGVLGTAGMGAQWDAGSPEDTRGAILRPSLANFVKIFGNVPITADSTSVEKGRTVGSTADRLRLGRLDHQDVSPRPCEFHPGGQQQPSGSPVLHEGDAAVAPFHQLLALRFLHQAVRRWPRLTVKLMQELGLWDILFSHRFLSGGSLYISRAIEGRCEPPALAPINNDSCAFTNVSKADYHAIGWGLVRDGTLLLLEAVVTVRCLLDVEREKPMQGPQEPAEGRSVGVHCSGPDRSREIEQFVSILTSSENSRPCAITAWQGCRWLRAAFSMESDLGSGLLLPSPLRVAVLRLAFQCCDHGNDARSDARVSRKVSWPLVHSSLSLALNVVRASQRGILFETSVAHALNGGRLSGEVVKPSVKSRAHHPTVSMTSEASSPCLHPSTTWWASGSGGSRTPASVNSLSPRAGRSFSFGDIHAQPQPPPKPPRPLPEVLFKAALDTRARSAVLFMATTLGAEACTEALVSLDVHGAGGEWQDFEGEEECASKQEVATAVISGLVEGYMCLCERAAVATVSGPAASDNGQGLLLDALNGACAFIRSGASQPTASVSMGENPSSSVGGDVQGAAGGTEVDLWQGQVRKGGKGVSPLLQEAFREHSAPARLLVALESIVCGPVTPGPSAESPPVLTEFCANIVMTSLSLFTSMMSGNSTGKRAFRQALSEHYDGKKTQPDRGAWAIPDGAWVHGGSSFVALANLVGMVPPASLCQALMEMLMDGEVPACILQIPHTNNGGENDQPSGVSGQDRPGREDDPEGREEDANTWEPPEIRNPFVVPLIFQLVPGWPASQQNIILQVFRKLLKGAGGGMVNRSLCCDVQPALMDQVRHITTGA